MNKRKLVILPVVLLSIGFLSSCSDNGISSRFDDLQSQINDIKTEISDLKTQISNLKKEMADADAAIKAEYDGKISEINKSIASLNTELENLNKKYQEDKEALTNDYTSKISNLKDYTDGKIAELNDKNNTLSQQLTDLSNKHDTDKKALKDDYDAQIAALSSSSQSERDRLEQDYNDKLAALNQTFADAQTNLQNQITANKNAMDTFASNYLTEKAALELDYNTKISNLTTTYQAKVAEIEGSIATCNSNISTLQTEMNKALLDNQNDYNAKINALTGRVAALETTTYHTVTFDVAQGSAVENQIIEHGEKVTEPVNPTRPGFTFEGWTYNGKPWVFYGYVVTEDMTLTANWEYIDYTVTFKNDDGTILETQEKVHYGDSVTYHGDIPVKPNPVDHYIYIFNGWDVDITNITGDTVAIAQYTAEYAPYTVNFYDEEDNLLYSTYVKEGETAKYIGETPTKSDDLINQVQYQFSGWDEISRTKDTINYRVHFEGCTKGLTFEQGKVYQYTGSALNVVIPSYWNGNKIVEIGETAFERTPVTSVSIPRGMETIGVRAFNVCTSLETIDIPNTVTTIGSEAFSSCQEIESITIPDSVVSIGFQAFSYCIMLKSIKLSANLEIIESGLFQGNKSLESIVIPDGVTSIENSAFSGCTEITSIDIPRSVTSIGMYAFSMCSGLSTVIIPNSIVSMGEYVFGFPASVTIIAENEYKPLGWDANWAVGAFVIWGFKRTIVVDGYYTYALASKNGERLAYLIDFDSDATHFSCPESVQDYKLVYISFAAFKNNNNLKSVDLPSCVKTIDSNAFANCKYLTTVSMQTGVESIDSGAFSNCESLTSISIPSSVTSIDNNAFRNCFSLQSIFIPSSVTTMKYRIFGGCSLLTVYCEAESKPDGWYDSWNDSVDQVYWGTNHIHNFTDGRIIEPNTCDNDGIREQTCSICGFTREVAIPACHEMMSLGGENSYGKDYAICGCTHCSFAQDMFAVASYSYMVGEINNGKISKDAVLTYHYPVNTPRNLTIQFSVKMSDEGLPSTKLNPSDYEIIVNGTSRPILLESDCTYMSLGICLEEKSLTFATYETTEADVAGNELEIVFKHHASTNRLIFNDLILI